MKLRKLVENENGLAELGDLEIEDAQMAWDLSIELDKAKSHLKKFREKKDELIKKHGKADETIPDRFSLSPEAVPLFNADIDKLVDVEVSIKFPKIPLSMITGSKVSAAQLSAWRDLNILIKK